MSLKTRTVAHLTRANLNMGGGVSQEQISGKNRANLSSGSGIMAGTPAANPEVKTGMVLQGTVPNTTRQRFKTH